MSQEKYALNCPKCGRVEGFVDSALADDEDDIVADSEVEIEEEVVRTASGTTTRVRCPRCGGWVKSDRLGPA